MLLKLAPEIPESAWIIPEPPKLNLDNAYTEGRTINTDSLLFVTAPAPITVTASEGWVLGAVNGTVTTASGGAYSINNTPVEEVQEACGLMYFSLPDYQEYDDVMVFLNGIYQAEDFEYTRDGCGGITFSQPVNGTLIIRCR